MRDRKLLVLREWGEWDFDRWKWVGHDSPLDSQVGML